MAVWALARSIPILILALSVTIKAGGVTNDSSVANSQTFDYVVVGAGLTGTAVAARLATARPDLRVLTIEAGTDNRTDPAIFDLLEFTAVFGGPLDWAWSAEDGRVIQGYVSWFCVQSF